MHDTRWPAEPWQHDWRETGVAPELERLTHLVLVDGRLVETWSEPVAGTRWQHHADRFDRELRRPEPLPPPPPPHEQVLTWLAAVVGPAPPTTAPLVEDGHDLPEVHRPTDRARLEAVAELLDAAAAQCFDAETSFALRRALLDLWTEDPALVTESRSAAQVAGGLCWVVGRANGLFRPHGEITVGQVQDALGLPGTLSTQGRRVHTALWGLRVAAPSRPLLAPDLLATGRPALLLARTRVALERLRARAVAARSADQALLPSGVE